MFSQAKAGGNGSVDVVLSSCDMIDSEDFSSDSRISVAFASFVGPLLGSIASLPNMRSDTIGTVTPLLVRAKRAVENAPRHQSGWVWKFGDTEVSSRYVRNISCRLGAVLASLQVKEVAAT